MIGAHGRTRTCTSLVRNQALCPLSYVCAVDAATETRTPVCRLRAGVSVPLDERGKIGSPTRIRTWIDRLTTGRPTVGRSGNGGAPRTRTELNLLARGIRGPCACPGSVCLGGHTLAPRVRSDCEKGLAHELGGAWGRFRAHLSAASTRRFHQVSFPGELRIGAADGNRTHVCVVATHGSAIELRTLVHRAGLEPAEPEGTVIYNQTS